MEATPVKIRKITKISSGKSLVGDVTVEDNNNLFVQDKISNTAVLAHNCALIEQKYNIKITGWALLYVARDDPFMVEVSTGIVTKTIKKAIIKKCELYDEQYEVVQDLQTKEDIEFLVDTKPCQSRDYYNEHFKGFTGCPLESLCFTPKIEKFVKLAFRDYKKVKKDNALVVL